MNGRYDDLLYLPHPASARHPRMSRADRATQFSPFAALTGYDNAVRETARLTDTQIQLAEDRKAELDLKQQILSEMPEAHPEITVVFFVPDAAKAGGTYSTVTGRLKKLDIINRLLILQSGSCIPLDHILQLDSPLLPDTL